MTTNVPNEKEVLGYFNHPDNEGAIEDLPEFTDMQRQGDIGPFEFQSQQKQPEK